MASVCGVRPSLPSVVSWVNHDGLDGSKRGVGNQFPCPYLSPPRVRNGSIDCNQFFFSGSCFFPLDHHRQFDALESLARFVTFAPVLRFQQASTLCTRQSLLLESISRLDIPKEKKESQENTAKMLSKTVFAFAGLLAAAQGK